MKILNKGNSIENGKINEEQQNVMDKGHFLFLFFFY